MLLNGTLCRIVLYALIAERSSISNDLFWQSHSLTPSYWSLTYFNPFPCSARTGDENGTDDVSEKDSEQDSVHGRPHSEIDFFDQKNSPFSSDDEDMLEFGSDEDGTTAKVIICANNQSELVI